MYGGVYRPVAFRPFLQQLPGPQIEVAAATQPITPPLFTNFVTTFAPLVRFVLRPDGTITAGSWDTGPTPAGNLYDNAGDDSDATWIEDTPA